MAVMLIWPWNIVVLPLHSSEIMLLGKSVKFFLTCLFDVTFPDLYQPTVKSAIHQHSRASQHLILGGDCYMIAKIIP